MRIITIRWRICLLAGLALSFGILAQETRAQNIVVLVNDDPITSFDVAQRMRWNAMTGGNFGERMKALLTGDAVNQRFRQLMMAANPRSQQEAQEAAERIKKELIEDAKRRVLADGAGTTKKAVIETLIEDKLKLQAAKKLDIKITDKEVEDNLAARAGADGSDRKAKIEEFYQRFEKDGIGRKTIQDVFRAQLAWRDVIRRVYGPRIQSIMAAIPDTTPAPSQNDLQYDVRVLRLAVNDAQDQKAVGERMLEAENLKNKFTSCAELPKEATLVQGATVKVVEKAKLTSFPKDVQPLIEKAGEGQMTPPILVGSAVESYAVCRKGVIIKANTQQAAAAPKPDPRQQEYERFSKSYLQDLKQKASIDYRSSE
jgi:peptidyl-prolyl cis-trans isomerase SurA